MGEKFFGGGLKKNRKRCRKSTAGRKIKIQMQTFDVGNF
jgi:hypothetical protein